MEAQTQHCREPPGPYGIYDSGSISPANDPTNNTVRLSPAAKIITTNDIIIFGAHSATGAVVGNTLQIDGAQLSTTGVISLYGGYANSGSGAATGNSLTISGGSFNAGGAMNLLGGFSFSGTATHNTVTLSGSPQFRATLVIDVYGWFSSGGDVFTDNTLNVWDYRGSGVSMVRNFQYYNFILPATMQPGQALLPVSGAVTLGTGTPSTVTGLSQMDGQTALKPGDTVTLLGGGTVSGSLANNGRSSAASAAWGPNWVPGTFPSIRMRMEYRPLHPGPATLAEPPGGWSELV